MDFSTPADHRIDPAPLTPIALPSAASVEWPAKPAITETPQDATTSATKSRSRILRSLISCSRASLSSVWVRSASRWRSNSLACLDVLSAGRLTVGVGVGWSEAEYAALGYDFHNRGERLDETIDLFRAVWSDDPVSFHGTFTAVDELPAW